MPLTLEVKKYYGEERSSNTGKMICYTGSKYCRDNITRTTSYQGYIGLIYPSDYGYATSGGNTINRDLCLEKVGFNWENDCQNKSEDKAKYLYIFLTAFFLNHNFQFLFHSKLLWV